LQHLRDQQVIRKDAKKEHEISRVLYIIFAK